MPSNSELKLYELLDVLDGPYGWKADLEKLIADKVADAYGEGEQHGRIVESEYTFENTPKFYTLQEKDHWFKERQAQLRAAHSSREDT